MPGRSGAVEQQWGTDGLGGERGDDRGERMVTGERDRPSGPRPGGGESPGGPVDQPGEPAGGDGFAVDGQAGAGREAGRGAGRAEWSAAGPGAGPEAGAAGRPVVGSGT